MPHLRRQVGDQQRRWSLRRDQARNNQTRGAGSNGDDEYQDYRQICPYNCLLPSHMSAMWSVFVVYTILSIGYMGYPPLSPEEISLTRRQAPSPPSPYRSRWENRGRGRGRGKGWCG